MAITTEAGLVTAIGNGKKIRFYKTMAAASAGIVYATVRQSGAPVAVPTNPTTTGTALSRTSPGALPILAPSGTSYVAEWEGATAFQASLMLADRLVEFGGLSGIVTSAQTVSALALPSRATGATDVELWMEIYVNAGTTAIASVTASYTNQSGTSGRTATLTGGIATNGLAQLHRSYQMDLQAGDTGVQSVQSLTLGTSSGTAGNIGLVLRRTLLTGPVKSAGGKFFQPWDATDLQQVGDDAYLEVMVLGSGSAGSIFGSVLLAQG